MAGTGFVVAGLPTRVKPSHAIHTPVTPSMRRHLSLDAFTGEKLSKNRIHCGRTSSECSVFLFPRCLLLTLDILTIETQWSIYKNFQSIKRTECCLTLQKGCLSWNVLHTADSAFRSQRICWRVVVDREASLGDVDFAQSVIHTLS